MSMTSKQPWYFGKIDDDEVKRRLQGTKTGTYLVQVSTKGGRFILCVNENGRVGDYPIERKGGRYSIEDRQFVDITAIIDFYKTHMLDTCVLTEIANKEGLPSPTSPGSPGGSFKY
ncbi:crk-like protein [Amphiura filiformis]|uniref:crk-like protein n=1 Tax=Amphiura filiformis TaxID=82378 RepID=UPI003B219C38